MDRAAIKRRPPHKGLCWSSNSDLQASACTRLALPREFERRSNTDRRIRVIVVKFLEKTRLTSFIGGGENKADLIAIAQAERPDYTKRHSHRNTRLAFGAGNEEWVNVFIFLFDWMESFVGTIG